MIAEGGREAGYTQYLLWGTLLLDIEARDLQGSVTNKMNRKYSLRCPVVPNEEVPKNGFWV